MQYGPRINPVILRQILEFLPRVGVDPHVVIRESGIDSSRLMAANCLVSIKQASQFIRYLVRQVPDRRLGFLVGKTATPVSMGIIGLGILTSTTVDSACKLIIDYPEAAGLLVELRCQSNQDGALSIQVRSHPGNEDISVFLTDQMFASLIQILRHVWGNEFSPVHVELKVPKPSYSGELMSFYGCMVYFDRPQNRMTFSPYQRAHVNQQADEVVCREVVDTLNRQFCFKGRDDLYLILEQAFSGRYHTPPKLLELAQMFGVSERSMRRLLVANGTTYRDVTDRAYKKRALELLQDQHLQVSDIGKFLGYSDPRNFRRAFERWFGMSPSSYRRQLKLGTLTQTDIQSMKPYWSRQGVARASGRQGKS